MTQPTTNSIHRAWLRRRRGRVVVGGGVVMCAVRVGGFGEPGTPPPIRLSQHTSDEGTY